MKSIKLAERNLLHESAICQKALTAIQTKDAVLVGRFMQHDIFISAKAVKEKQNHD